MDKKKVALILGLIYGIVIAALVGVMYATIKAAIFMGVISSVCVMFLLYGLEHWHKKLSKRSKIAKPDTS